MSWRERLNFTWGRALECVLTSIAAICIAFAITVGCAFAQQNHAAGHNDYQNWASKKTSNCCNNDDCGDLAETQWQETTAGVSVKIDNKWCPVKQEHFITKGKSPNGEKAHACVQKASEWSPSDPCERLLCFTGTTKG